MFELITPAFLLLGIPAIVITGISKSGFGGAFGALAVAGLALVMPPLEAAAVTLPILCLMDWLGLKVFWRRWDVDELKRLLPGAMLGTMLATTMAVWVNADVVRALVGVTAVAFVAHAWWPRAAAERPPSRPHAAMAMLASTVSGFTSFIAHAGGPPLLAYLLPRQLPRQTFVATTVIYFAVLNLVKLVPYTWLGQFNARTLGAALVLAPFAPLGIWLGQRVQGRLSPKVYRTVCLSLLGLSGIKLLFDGLTRL